MELDQCWVSAYHLQVRGGLNLLSVEMKSIHILSS